MKVVFVSHEAVDRTLEKTSLPSSGHSEELQYYIFFSVLLISIININILIRIAADYCINIQF